jgi:carboxypeptidase C (cathepsin A)
VPIFAVFVVRLAASKCLNSLKSHCIDSLPGINTTLTSDHYSGYLDAGEGSHFFYWLIESEGDPAKDPLIVWLVLRFVM